MKKWYKRASDTSYDLWEEEYIVKNWMKAVRGFLGVGKNEYVDTETAEKEFPFEKYLDIAQLTRATADDIKRCYIESEYDTGHILEAVIDCADMEYPKNDTTSLYDVALPTAVKKLGW